MSLKNRDFRTVLKIPRKRDLRNVPKSHFDYIFKIPPTVLLTAYFDFSLLIICGPPHKTAVSPSSKFPNSINFSTPFSIVSSISVPSLIKIGYTFQIGPN